MKKKLGEILVASGMVTPADIQAALEEQSRGEPARLGDLLLAAGRISPQQLARALATQHGVPFTELPPIPSAILELVPMDFQKQFRFVPFKVGKGSISIAMADLSHAESDILPVLRRRFAIVQIFVAPGDAIDAVQAAVSGQYDSPSNVSLPSVAPPIAPVFGASPPPRNGSGSLPSFDVELGEPEEAPGPSTSRTPRPALAEPVEQRATGSSPSSLFFEASGTGFLTSPPASAPPSGSPYRPATPGRPSGPNGPVPPLGGAGAGPPVADVPFFSQAPVARPVPPLSDRAFMAGVPMSSPSSLAKLVIEPELPPLPIAAPADLKAAVNTARTSAVQSRPGPAPVAAPSRQTLPEWLQAEIDSGVNGAAQGWTGVLDALPPSKLILAVTKALLRRGILTEQDIIDDSELKK